jgi:hypothetical protein
MQNLLDSLCRCFGTPGAHEPADFGSLAGVPIPNQRTPSTPDMKRRASRLALQDKQWDALFSDPVSSKSSKNSKKQSKRVVSETPPARPHGGIEYAQTVAQAKLQANMQTSHKRKRSTSKDDIFRSKKSPTLDAKCNPSPGGPCQPGSVNPISRFLTNHPALANSLCFATPVRDSEEEDEEPATVPFDNHSVMSEGCDETITSTLYYETTKLASLRPERSPPMPLFTDYSVDRGDDIRKIVAMDTHSSAKRKDTSSYYVPGFEDTLHGYDMHGDTYEEQCPPPPPVELTEEITPQLTSSTDSSRESDRSR